MAKRLVHTVNEEVLEAGDHIYVWKTLPIYNHHGIYMGDGRVIHFNGTNKRNAHVQETSLVDFLKGKTLKRFRYGAVKLEVVLKRKGTCTTAKQRDRSEICGVARYLCDHPDAWSKYSLWFNNCEHFAFFCSTGLTYSEQADQTVSQAVGGSAIAIIGVVASVAFKVILTIVKNQ